MAAPEEDYSSLPLEERLVHKIWKVRVGAYEELAKKFRVSDPDDDSAYRPYLDSLKPMVVDSNAVAQDNGLSTVLAFLQYAPHPERTLSLVVPGLIEKCLGSTRTSTKQKALDILYLFVEVDTSEPVIELLIPALDHKQPKVVHSVVTCLRELIKQFGTKVISVKPVLKTFAKIFAHSDKNVRQEAQNLAVELYGWLGQAMQPYLQELKPVQVKELTEAFEKLPPEKPKPTRLLRSQQNQPPPVGASSAAPAEPEEVDVYDLVEAMDLMKKIPEDFYTNLASSKWKERKEALEAILEHAKAPKIKNDQYGDLVGALAKRVADANIVCALLATNIIEGMATGLRKHFTYKALVMPPLLEKLKEKKQNVVDALRNCLDAVFKTVEFGEILDDLSTGFGHKNPNVKAETIRWLTRCLKTIKSPPLKSDAKTLIDSLIKASDESSPEIREAAFESIGTLQKAVGERVVAAFLDGLDPLKLTKIKEFYDKAEVKVVFNAPKPAPPPAATGKKTKKAAAPPKDFEFDSADAPPPPAPKKKPPAAAAMDIDFDGDGGIGGGGDSKPSAPPKPKGPPAALAKKKPAAAPPAAASTTGKDTGKKGKGGSEETVKYRFNSEAADEQIPLQFPDSILKGLAEGNWKLRLAAMEEFTAHCEQNVATVESELVVRQMNKKPGPKESNFQVQAKAFNLMEWLANNSSTFSRACVALSIVVLTDKLGDIKLKKAAGDALTAYAEKFSLQFVLSQAYDPWRKQKAPKVLADSLAWVQASLSDFGIAGLAIKECIDFLKGCLSNSNAAVRNNAVACIGVLRMFVGPTLRSFFEDLSGTVLSTIDAEFARVAALEPPKPTKAVVAEGGADVMDELFPRVDISGQLNKLVAGVNDGNWKIRKENLDAIQALIEASKRIKPTIGDILPAFKARLADSNKNLVVQTLELLKMMAEAMDKPFDKHWKYIGPHVISCMTDNKQHLRQAALNTLEQVYTVCGLDTVVPTVAAGLQADSPHSRSELAIWLKGKFGEGVGKADLTPLVTPMFLCICDRSVEVRKNIQNIAGVIIASVGYDYCKKQTTQLKGPQVTPVLAVLDEHRTASASAPPPSAAAASSEASTSAAAGDTAKGVARKRKPIASAKPAAGTRESPAPPPEPTTEAVPILSADKRSKDIRAEKDKGLNKWAFDTPRKEHLELLQEQTLPHFSEDVRKLMFSTDHHRDKHYMEAISMLDDFLLTSAANVDATPSYAEVKRRYVSVLDLIFKYLTIRLQDTGTTILIKMLDLLDHLLNVLEEESYQLSEYEASVFFPVFVQKLGETKDALRTKIKNLFKRFGKLYPASKLFTYVMENGLKSKNSRTRAESLEELGRLIQETGLNVFQPTKACPVIAVHIGDRDAAVRNAAINALLQVYLLAGDVTYKHIGRLSEKDKSMLEEKFRRAKPPPPPEPEPVDEPPARFSFQKPQKVSPSESPTLTAAPPGPEKPSLARRALERRAMISQNPAHMQQESPSLNATDDTDGSFGASPSLNPASSMNQIPALPSSSIGSGASTVGSGGGGFGFGFRRPARPVEVPVENIDSPTENDNPVVPPPVPQPRTFGFTRRLQPPRPVAVDSNLADEEGTPTSPPFRAEQSPPPYAQPPAFNQLPPTDLPQSHNPYSSEEHPPAPQQQPPSRLGIKRFSAAIKPSEDNEVTQTGIGAPSGIPSGGFSAAGTAPSRLRRLVPPSAGGSSIKPPGDGGFGFPSNRPHTASTPTGLNSQQIRPGTGLQYQPRNITTANPALAPSGGNNLTGNSMKREIAVEALSEEINSGDSYRSILALKQLEEYISTKQDIVIPHVNELVKAIVIQIHLSFTSPDTRSQTFVKLCKHLINCLMQIFSKKETASVVVHESLAQVLQQLLARLLDQGLQKWEDGSQLTRALNMLMIRILDNTNRNVAFSVLIEIMQNTSLMVRTETGEQLEFHQKFGELVMKCLWKLTKLLQESIRSDLLKLNQLFLAIHNFLLVIPPAEWKRRVSEGVPLTDVPLRTIKTMLHEAKTGLGENVLDHLDLIPDAQFSYVHNYLVHMLDSHKKKSRSQSSLDLGSSNPATNTASTPAATTTTTTSTASSTTTSTTSTAPPNSAGKDEGDLQKRVRQIFVKISTREHTKQGVLELYEFQQEHPEAEALVNSHLKKSGEFFQSYIKRSLSNIAAERNPTTPTTAGSNNSPSTVSQTLTPMSPSTNIDPTSGENRHSFGSEARYSFGSASGGGSDMRGLQSIPESPSPIPPSVIGGNGNAAIAASSEVYREKLQRLQQMFGYSSNNGNGGDASMMPEARPRTSYEPSKRQSVPVFGNLDIAEPRRPLSMDMDQLQTIAGLKERLARMKTVMKSINNNG